MYILVKNYDGSTTEHKTNLITFANEMEEVNFTSDDDDYIININNIVSISQVNQLEK